MGLVYSCHVSPPDASNGHMWAAARRVFFESTAARWFYQRYGPGGSETLMVKTRPSLLAAPGFSVHCQTILPTTAASWLSVGRLTLLPSIICWASSTPISHTTWRLSSPSSWSGLVEKRNDQSSSALVTTVARLKLHSTFSETIET